MLDFMAGHRSFRCDVLIIAHLAPDCNRQFAQSFHSLTLSLKKAAGSAGCHLLKPSAGSARCHFLKPSAGENKAQQIFAPIAQHPKQPRNKSEATRRRGIGKGDARRICKAYTWENRKGEGGCAAKQSRFLPSLGFPLAFAPLRPAKFTVEVTIQHKRQKRFKYSPGSHRRRKGGRPLSQGVPLLPQGGNSPPCGALLMRGSFARCGERQGLCP